MPRSPLTTVFCLSLLLLCGIGLTIVSFFALIVPEDRGPTFFAVLASLCAAEAVLFGYLAYFATVPQSVKRPSPAVRMRILVLVMIWFLIVLCTGIFAVHPEQADTFFSDKIIIWQSVITFLFLLGAFFLHWQDVNIQQRDEAPQRERVRLESYAGGIDTLLATVRKLETRQPNSAMQLDRLGKRLDTLKTHLLSASPAAERPTERLVPMVDVAKIENQLSGVHSAMSALTKLVEPQFGAQLDQVCERIDAVIESLRHREDVLTF